MSLLTRGLVELLRLAGLLGCGLALLGLGLLVWMRAKAILNGGPPAILLENPAAVLYLLDAVREAGVPFLLSAVLFVLCEIALRPRPHRARLRLAANRSPSHDPAP